MNRGNSPAASFRRSLNFLRQLSWLVILLGFSFLVIGLLAVLDFGLPYPTIVGESAKQFHTDLGAEFVGIGIAVLVIDTASSVRSIIEKRRRLLRELGSSDNGTALAAAYELEQIGWISDGTLRGVSLMDANLSEVKLRYADFSNVDFRRAIVRDAYLREAKLVNARLNGADFSHSNLEQADMQGSHWGSRASLEEANLYWVNLVNVDLQGTNLRKAHMTKANLEGANLNRAQLEGALLMHANLLGASLGMAAFDEDTRLPNSAVWRPDTDLDMFTDPVHPQFWRSENLESPAYRESTDDA